MASIGQRQHCQLRLKIQIKTESLNQYILPQRFSAGLVSWCHPETQLTGYVGLKSKEFRVKLPVLIQVRNASHRLPRKASRSFIWGLTLLDFVIERLRSRGAEDVFVLTSTSSEDDVIEEISAARDVEIFRGSLYDVQHRFIEAAEHFNLDIFARATADNPFVDYRVLQQAWKLHCEYRAGYTSSKLNTTFPIGIETEIVDSSALIQARKISKSAHDREHVTPYLYSSPEYGLGGGIQVQDFSRTRDHLSDLSLTVDTYEQFSVASDLASLNGVSGLQKNWEKLLEIQIRS